MKWQLTEDNWNNNYKWFLVDEGRIQYSFKDRKSAMQYREKGHLDYMLLTHLDDITHQTMLDPAEASSWNNKIPRCIYR